MKTTGIFFGSSTGMTENIAHIVADKLGIAASDVHNVEALSVDLISGYDVLLLGSSTWGDGELQDDWYDALKKMKTADLSGKEIALFGCGDSESYGDTFCDATRTIYQYRFSTFRTNCTPCRTARNAVLSLRVRVRRRSDRTERYRPRSDALR